MFKVLFILVLIGVLVPISQAQCTAPRVRRAWRNLNRAEQQLYIEAVLLLKQRGIYNQFVNMHTSTRTLNYAHGASGFLPWHRWFLWQYETALRDLGTKYQCITVPYWDSERDSATKSKSAVLGDLFGNYMTGTDLDAGTCVRDGRFTRASGWTTTENQCLLRAFNDGPTGMGFSGESEVAGYITGLPRYGSTDGFRGTIEGLVHSGPHVWIGGDMSAFGSPNDPLFFLHHCNVDRIWALWQDCHDYDRVDYTTGIKNSVYSWFQTSNTPGIRDGPIDPMPYAFSDGSRDQRYYTGLPAGQAAPLPIDVMRIMGNKKITSMSYTYDPADNLKGLLDRTGARCQWNWFVVPNAVLTNGAPAPAPPPPTPPATTPPATTPPATTPPANTPPATTPPATTPPATTPTFCGNGIVEAGEQCDEPARTCGTCVDCKLLCGNGIVDCGEDCDDGNRVGGDACPANCRRAHAWRRVRSDLSLKRDVTGSMEFDPATEAYMNGELS